MKKLLLALTLAAFAIATQADEARPAKNTKESSCCSAKTSTQAKATKSKNECSGCCSEKQQVKLMSPKAAAEMGR